MVSYLVALDPTFSFPLLFGRFSVCLSFVIVGKTHWSITCFLSEMGSCLSWSISLFFFSKIAPRCSDPGTYFFFCSVFKVCVLSEVFEFCHFFYFLLIY